MKKKVELLADCIREPQVLAKDFHRPQTKFAKVMFSQVFDFPQGGLGLCPGGSLSGVSLSGGSLSGGVSVQEDPSV